MKTTVTPYLFFLLLLTIVFSNAVGQTAYIQVRQNSLSEEISPDFGYTITGAGSYSATLSDRPNAINRIFNLSGNADGGLFAIANSTASWTINPGTIYYKPAQSSQWQNTGVQALKVQGGNNGGYISLFRSGTSTAALQNTGDQIKYKPDAVSAETDITYNLAGERFMAIAHNYDDMLYVLVRTATNIGTIFKKTVAATTWETTGISDVYNLVAIPYTNQIAYAKYTAPDINFIFIANNDNTGVTNWGNPIPLWNADKIEDMAITYNQSGQMEIWALSVRLIYKSVTAGTWVREAGINDMRNITSTGTKQLNTVMWDGATVNIPHRIFLRTQDGVYLDDERVRTDVLSNTVNIPVAPGTYTITQTPAAGWHLTDIRVNETTTAGTIKNMPGNQVTVVVSANEVVVAEFENQLTDVTSISATCGSGFVENFSSYANGNFGNPMTGFTNYHKATGNFGYGHYAIMSSTSALNYGADIFDHTSGNATGSMLVVDAAFEKGIFYRRRLTGLVAGGTYSFGAWAANFNPPAGDKPNIIFEVYDLNGNLLSAATTGNILTSEWRNFNTIFTSDGSDVELVLRNNTLRSGGNDLAIDDISFGLAIPVPEASVTYNCTLGNGTITVTSPLTIGGGSSYEYSIDGTTWQTSPVFAGLSNGVYTLQVRYEGTTGACTSSQVFEVKSCVTVTGNVWNDSNGNASTDGGESPVSGSSANNNGGTSVVTGGSLFVNLVDASNRVIESVQVNPDGTFNFSVAPDQAYKVILTTASNTAGSTLTSGTGPSGWEATGTSLNGMPNTANSSYIIDLGTVTTNVANADFGVQRPPVAEPKSFTVGTSAFSPGAPANFVPVPGYQYIPMSSTALTGYTTGGSLSGTDGEDCAAASSCNTGGTFSIQSINANTLLYYDFGGARGVELIDVTSGPVQIENFDPSKMVIFGQEGTGTTGTPVGFTYTITDNAGTTSSPVNYSIITSFPLPVKLNLFTVKSTNTGVVLDWVTGSEESNKGFAVEHSKNGSVWLTIGFVNSKALNGNSNTKLEYTFTDNAPFTGNNYYRLKQVDIDGRFDYSAVKSIRVDGMYSIKVYPNPVSDNITIEGLKGGESIYISGSTGQYLGTIRSSGKTCTIDVKSLAPGILFVKIIDEAGIISANIKVLKQ